MAFGAKKGERGPAAVLRDRAVLCDRGQAYGGEGRGRGKRGQEELVLKHTGVIVLSGPSAYSIHRAPATAPPAHSGPPHRLGEMGEVGIDGGG